MIGKMFRKFSLKNSAIIQLANTARDAKQYHRAALLYEEFLHFAPDDSAIHIQCGHMFKEAGDLTRAERHYDKAKRLNPNDPDLSLQLGHFYKVSGRLKEAELSYKRAIELNHDSVEPAIELGELYRSGWRSRSNNGAEQQNGADNLVSSQLTTETIDVEAETDTLSLFRDEELIPELELKPVETKLHGHNEDITVRWLGHIGRTHGGIYNILRGVDAIRGFCISSTPIVELRATLNGLRFYRGTPHGFPLLYEKYDQNKRKYVFNIWHDFSNFREGLYDIQLQFLDENGGLRVYSQRAVISPPLREDEYPNSDRLVSVSASDKRSLEEQINSRPSMVRLAKRTRFASPPQNVLIQRVDQLGDMVISVPALRRLRQFLPDTRFVGLLSVSNVDFAKTLNLFDDVVAIDFPDDQWERRRTMSLEKQRELRRRLNPFKFDVAIDLTESNVSRPLLLLSGAPFLIGFRDDQSPWLSAFYDAHTRDPRNGHEEVSPAIRLLGLVEWFGTLLVNHSQVIRRNDLTRERLATYRLSASDRFAVLHTGARLKFSCWPYYDKLASMILDETDLKVVMITDEPTMRSRIAHTVFASTRFQLLDKLLPFDDFDALLSFCAVFVGNDSGPAHLASLRGANVVNLYLARHNWNEWGHENAGYVISRRIPCAGCNIHHDYEECGKDFSCITHITPTEVFNTVMKLI